MRLLATTTACLALAITAEVSAAPAVNAVRVPGLTGKTESAAQCALAAVGLRWRFRGDRLIRSHPIIPCSGHAAVNPDPKVLSQTPRAGSQVRPRSVVVLDDECLRRVRHHHPACA